ncbi:MAG: hypothetical protein A2026_02990 [Deltaproteobacteria bacterium RBG_19FT_COMBO_46_12]|nr:MAG: hypothetical protein A2026_02990 [Deltaproteobacteria bacterium RBG_19FT_COMBO_46_12]
MPAQSSQFFHSFRGARGDLKSKPLENPPKSPFSKGGHYKQTLFTDRLLVLELNVLAIRICFEFRISCFEFYK